ncbi:hypothetical protein IWW36_001289 [Coemansia brasiliensis]|uniref:ZZ-type zinc finger-containing protein 3 n=1 Tax=Coemansia brasiliensis TaxID=2650707 RepID=A0A9W8I9D6_9FUNG|nr:hypothetical protein IWW36_001289 [Coemansia brasiliensis]
MAGEETIQEIATIDQPLRVSIPSPVTENAPSEISCVERNNGEYMLVFRAIEALRSQLARAKSDIEVLTRLRVQALDRPLEYIESVIAGTAPQVPKQQDVVEVPDIDIDAYMSSASPESVAKYMHLAQSQGIYVGSRQWGLAGQQRSMSTRAVSARSTNYALWTKGSKRSFSQRGLASSAGQLTGATAVATPEQSPSPQFSYLHEQQNGHMAELQTAPIQEEDMHLALATEAENASDDGQYSQLLQAVSATPMQSGQASHIVDTPSTSRPSGKTLFSPIPQPATPQPIKRGRGRPRKNQDPTPKPARKPYRHRGPTRTESGTPKPPSYNVPWSDEEQQRLEELLLIYPEEEVANDRWRKISEALGTRTMRQVASRVQKYFIKLSKAGLPVPGKVPDTSTWTSINSRATPSSDQRSNGTPKKRGRRAGASSKRKHVEFTSSEDEMDIDLDMESPKPVADPKGKQAERSPVMETLELPSGDSWMVPPLPGDNIASTSRHGSSALRSAKAVHLGYRCDSCFAEPIVGIRWHCMECRGAHTVDLCDECREEGVYETPTHLDTHNFQPVREPEMEPYYANEIAAPALQEYSYLA